MDLPKKTISVVLWTAFILGFTIFLVVFNATLDYPRPADTQSGNHYEKAQVTKIVSDTLAPDPDFPEIQIGIQELELKILTGEQKGKPVLAKNFVGRVDNKPAKVGTKMIVSSYDGFVSTMVVNYSREFPIYILAVLFFVLVILFGRKKGLKSIFSLVFSLVSIVFLFIPMLIRGANPVIASIVVVILSTAVTLLSLNGWCKKTIVAGISCIVCTFGAGAIAMIVGAITHISTYTTPEAEHMIFIAQSTSLKLHDILFAGIIIAASGAMMDTTMSIASALWEMLEIDPKLSGKQLFASGMNIGRDVMGTMTNTLILAFTGSSINALMMIFMYDMPYMQTVNLELLIVEIIKGLSGSIAVVLAIPVTALLCAKFYGQGGNKMQRRRITRH